MNYALAFLGIPTPTQIKNALIEGAMKYIPIAAATGTALIAASEYARRSPSHAVALFTSVAAVGYFAHRQIQIYKQENAKLASQSEDLKIQNEKLTSENAKLKADNRLGQANQSLVSSLQNNIRVQKDQIYALHSKLRQLERPSVPGSTTPSVTIEGPPELPRAINPPSPRSPFPEERSFFFDLFTPNLFNPTLD